MMGTRMSRADIVAARRMAERLDRTEAYEQWRRDEQARIGMLPCPPALTDTTRAEACALFGADRADVLRRMADDAERAVVAFVTSLSGRGKLRAAVHIMRREGALRWDRRRDGDWIHRGVRLRVGADELGIRVGQHRLDNRERPHRIVTARMLQALWSAYLKSGQAPSVDEIAEMMR